MPRKQFPVNARPLTPEGMREQCKSCAYCGKKESLTCETARVSSSRKGSIPADIKAKAVTFEEECHTNYAEFVKYTGEVYIRTFQYGRFCTQKCAVRFANSAYKAGYRVEN